MKRCFALLLVLVLICLSLSARGIKESEEFIGVIVYREDDVFISEVRAEIEKVSSLQYPLHIVNSSNSQITQNAQVDEFLASGACRALVINPVDRTSVGLLIEKAKKEDVPIVFFNKEPLASDMKKWDKVYYVGADASECGKMVGELFCDYYEANSDSIDRNKDGVLQYVMIKGEPGHQDTELRTEYTINTLLENGIAVERLHESSGKWEREKGRSIMERCIATHGDEIEAVFCNNDEMAIGALEAIFNSDIFDDIFIPVTGVDGTSHGMAAIRDGSLLCTVQNDASNQAMAICNLAQELANGNIPTEDNVGYPIVDDRYIFIPYSPVMADWVEMP